MKGITPKQSDEEFLERFGDKWFRGAVGKLNHLEDQWDKAAEFDLDEMPDWAGRLLVKLFEMFNLKPSRPEMMNEEQFGKLLGAKVLISRGIGAFFKRYDHTDDGTRGKLTRALGGAQAIEYLRAQLPLTRQIEKLRKSVLSKVESLPLDRQGLFFRGYGNGLLFSSVARTWLVKDDSRTHSYGYICAFAFLHWRRIEELRTTGGWKLLFQEFIKSLPDGVEISEDAFRKDLRNAGIGAYGKRGAPKKNPEHDLL
ncbi:MAG: hypothetical protein WCH98_10695 [Verrucomicrobiota bacterium]